MFNKDQNVSSNHSKQRVSFPKFISAFRNHQNQGFSLAEIMVAAGMLGVLSLGVSQLMQNSAKKIALYVSSVLFLLQCPTLPDVRAQGSSRATDITELGLAKKIITTGVNKKNSFFTVILLITMAVDYISKGLDFFIFISDF